MGGQTSPRLRPGKERRIDEIKSFQKIRALWLVTSGVQSTLGTRHERISVAHASDIDEIDKNKSCSKSLNEIPKLIIALKIRVSLEGRAVARPK